MLQSVNRVPLLEAARRCGVELCAEAVPVCCEAMESFTDRLLMTAQLVSQHGSRFVVVAGDVSYALRVMAEADRCSLGVCYDTTLLCDEDRTGEQRGERGRKRSTSDISSAASSCESDSMYASSEEGTGVPSYSSSSSGEDEEERVSLDEDSSEEDMDIKDTIAGSPTRVYSFQEAQSSDEAPARGTRSPRVERTQPDALTLVPAIVQYCARHSTRVEMERSAFMVLRDILKQQMELSFLGMPSLVFTEHDSSRVNLRLANSIAQWGSEAGAARSNISTASATEINPAFSSGSSKRSSAASSSHSAATTPSLSDLRHLRFDLDDSIISMDDKSNCRLSFSSMTDVSLEDIAAERSFGRTPFFNRRWAGTPKSESAMPIVHGSPEFALQEGGLVGTPYVSAFLSTREKEKKQAHSGLTGSINVPQFEGLSPVVSAPSSAEKQSKRQRS